ncbi:MAG: HAD family hydrolase [Actinomycetota bacterium]
MARPKAVFFDAGETLVYPHPSFAELFTEVLRAEDVVVDPAVVQQVVSAYSQKFTETVQSGEAHLWSTSPERSRTFWDGVYRGFLEEVGVTEDTDRLVDRLYATFADLASYRLHPDVIPTLDRLRDADVLLGVISNFEEWLERLLETLGVTTYFPIRVISGIEGVEKPDPEIFRIALERGGVAAGESVYVGDHPFFDIQGAEEVGMQAVLIDRRGRYPEAEGIRITSLEDLPTAIEIDG